MNYLIVGLGNIGVEYANTRHNMGFMVLDAWAQASNIVFESGRYGSTATVSFKGRKFTLLKPSTYMNLSGKAVRYWMNELKIQPDQLLVISDDLNIPFGTLRLRKNGSAGGHNGLTNINELIGTQEYARIRMGIGNDFGRGQQVDYVLGELSKEEKEQMPELCKRVIDGVKAWALMGADRAMNTLNTKPKTRPIEPEK
ncbi:MAG: aminoacyl-tRNA hydrolase [Bacteroidales bacterium]|nr:aminoacyl-tRNA hydrolase [Bacteroidales bacterium]